MNLPEEVKKEIVFSVNNIWSHFYVTLPGAILFLLDYIAYSELSSTWRYSILETIGYTICRKNIIISDKFLTSM